MRVGVQEARNSRQTIMISGEGLANFGRKGDDAWGIVLIVVKVSVIKHHQASS